MWVFGDIVFLAAMVGLVWAWMRFEDARTVRLDARLDREEGERREELERCELSRSRDG